MPPKKAKGAPKSAKVNKKETQKVIEDKTFGLKNKNRSSKVQKYVENVKQQAMNKNKKGGPTNTEAEKARLRKKREEEAEMEALLNQVVVQPKPKFGQNPADVPCAQFAATGSCPRGSKCKFQHGHRAAKEKLNLYVDQREQLNASEALEKVTTDIVCKHFLEAVNNNSYGFNWRCPEGGHNCKYQHKLLEGWVPVTSGTPADIDEEEQEPIEEMIERERSLITTHTPVTDETFRIWKERKLKEKSEKLQKEEEEAMESFKSGRRDQGTVSGRAYFKFDPSLFDDQD
ncbi:hypothetical protein P9112_002506 [Eukaryota sp. TZLM1-RC]